MWITQVLWTCLDYFSEFTIYYSELHTAPHTRLVPKKCRIPCYHMMLARRTVWVCLPFMYIPPFIFPWRQVSCSSMITEGHRFHGTLTIQSLQMLKSLIQNQKVFELQPFLTVWTIPTMWSFVIPNMRYVRVQFREQPIYMRSEQMLFFFPTFFYPFWLNWGPELTAMRHMRLRVLTGYWCSSQSFNISPFVLFRNLLELMSPPSLLLSLHLFISDSYSSIMFPLVFKPQ